MKTCTKCGVEKSATAEYFHRKPTAKDGFAPHCKDCVSECKAQYYARPEIKERVKARQKQYRARPGNKEKQKAQLKQYRARPENKEKQKAWRKQYRARPEIKEKEKTQQKQYRARPEIKEKKKAYGKQYRARPEIKDHRNERYRQKMKDNPQFAMRERIRTRIRYALKGARKDSRTDELVGGIENYKRHIESLWEPGMSWHNHTLDGWHIDHIKPCSSFDLTDPEQQKICFHYLNCQPLWAKDNLSKGGRQ